MKKIIIILSFLVLSIGITQMIEPIKPINQMNRHCASPPFVGGKHAVVIPNILICHDMTGSMLYSAYRRWGEPYDSSMTYYGICDPYSYYDRHYVYRQWDNYTSDWDSFYVFKKTSSPAGCSLGNFINWRFMVRMDVSRKVLTGGKGCSYNNKDTLYFGQPSGSSYFGGNYRWNYYFSVATTDSSEISIGMIRQVADQDTDYVWDEDAPHFALQTFSTNSRFYYKVKCPFGDSLIHMLNVLNNHDGNNRPTGGTPVGNAIFEAIHYLRYCEPHWSSKNSYTWDVSMVGTPSDPWYEIVGTDTFSVSCRPTFCIVVGDGGSNSDSPKIDFADCDHLPHTDSPHGTGHNTFWKYDFDLDWADSGGVDPYDDCTSGDWPYNHDRPADDYAYYAHVTDLRPDNDSIWGIPDDQTVIFYSIYLFAKGEDSNADSILFRKIAKHGGFIDLNEDKKPGPAPQEWDIDGDGRPDNFFYADQGQQLEDAFREIFIEISAFARITSASASTIASSGVHGEGVAYQAQFYPRVEAGPDSIWWTGAATAIWLDYFGYLREDTDKNNKLHLKNDYVADMYYSDVENQTMAKLWQDTAGFGIETTFVYKGEAPVESLKFVWSAAKMLNTKDWSRRYVWTSTDTLATRAWFRTWNSAIDEHLNLFKKREEQYDSLIEYVLGRDYPGNPKWRERSINGVVQKLGDIIYSSPICVGSPSEGFHQIYGDNSYYKYWNAFKDRPYVMYCGANDGMIHAFNAGKYIKLDNPADPFEIAEIKTHVAFPGWNLGDELWAYIPRNLLPHLQWLADTSYCHVYYNDLKPYAADAKIFTPGWWHPEGWGTMLICGQRFGGGQIRTLSVFPGPPPYRSSYTAFDATYSYYAAPYPMWQFNDAYLGYTLCIPALIKIQDKWFVIFGSGPQTLYGESKRAARVYVLDAYSGTLLHSIILPDAGTVISNIFGADWGLNYSVDLIYFGTYDLSHNGKIYRIMTHENTNPKTWTLTEVINLGKPITSEGSVATDERGNLWVYFGSGKYFSNVDVANTDTMVYFGIKDDTTITKGPVFTLGDLLDVTDVEVYIDSVSGYITWDSLLAAVDNKDGWIRRFDSLPGERVVTPTTVLGGAVVFTSFIPTDTTGTIPEYSDLCLGGGGGPQTGHLWALYFRTGTAYRAPMLGVQLPAGENVAYTTIIGDMPSEPVMHIGTAQEKVFIQTAGGLVDFATPLPHDPRGGVMLWRGR